MAFASNQSQASMDTAFSSPQSSPLLQEFPSGRWLPEKKKRNLLLFFDGTGNQFNGTEKDTNAVKLLSMLDRNHEDQFHYYQTGIGTYQVNERSVHKGPAGKLWETVYSSVDQGFGLTFDAHIMAGYRFLMRYYETGDDIYMFGFSRGAYTAKFLARMVNTVGLLCRGNEEMVPFAYRLYDRHLDGEFQCKDNNKTKKQKEKENGLNGGAVVDHGTDHDDNKPCTSKEQKREDRDEEQRVQRNQVLRKFSNSFCRKEPNPDHDRKKQKLVNIKVKFLGLWDCVNSVSVMERKATKNVKVKGTADIIRHAVAVDERRVKFKAALFQQDRTKRKHNHEDIKEVWFPGNHCDVGGGYHPVDDLPEKGWFFKRMCKEMYNNIYNKMYKMLGGETSSSTPQDERLTCVICRDCGLCKDKKCHSCNDDKICDLECLMCKQDLICRDTSHTETDNIIFLPCQLSDITLAWMVRELELLAPHIKWQRDQVNEFKHRLEHNKSTAISGAVHDTLKFGPGTNNPAMAIFWNLLEYFPLIRRWESKFVPGKYVDGKYVEGKYVEGKYIWEWAQSPPNIRSSRDIPLDATLHHTVIEKLLEDRTYNPENKHAENQAKCLDKPSMDKDDIAEFYRKAAADHPGHCTYQFEMYAKAEDQKREDDNKMGQHKVKNKDHKHHHHIEFCGA
ncbi:hypothetical protein CSUB01_01745 [Colletotrichum sublineola]|uniref:T6SS Phospholipase effector Tle1-like catalytic domain-containing protein n=1 Tax=Colletotrichum sublineola TaxID=1173701 RepID=A0A066XDU2_COLSU|nr:hypothetical protein CSUB01_01745 [Colletotrichum sublineola]